MKKSNFLLIILIVILFVALILRFQEWRNRQEEEIKDENITNQTPIERQDEETELAEVVVFSPLPGDTVSSPINIQGQARGYWFFEAVLPIKLETEEGETIVDHYAQTEEDWMSTEYVSFATDLEFSTEEKAGNLIILKSNPSGLPENDAHIKIPLKFK